MNDIEVLNKLIINAKEQNDDVLVDIYVQALNHILEKQRQDEEIKLKSKENINQEENTTQEKKKEEVIQKTNEENKQSKVDEADIQEVTEGEVSRLITTKTGNHIVESKYMDISSNAKNSSLRTELNGVLLTLALDDVTKQENATKKLFDIIDKYNNPEDINEIMTFIVNISKIGIVGAKAKESIINNDREQSYDKYFNNEYDSLKKQVDILDMEYDEQRAKPTINDNHIKEIIERYQYLIHKLEKLYDETANKVDSKKSEDLKKLISNVKKQVESINKLINGLKEITEFTDKAFNSL